VAKALRKKIQKIAAKMGYRPNAAAAALTHFRTTSKTKPIESVLAWLNFWPEPKQLYKIALFDAQWKGAIEAAESLGYRVEEFICNESLPPERLKRILTARGIQGILLPPQRPPIPREKYDFDWSRFAVIRIGHSVPYPKAHVVAHAQASNTVDLMVRIQQLGYERIGYVTSKTIRAYGLFDAGYMKVRAMEAKKDQIPVLMLADQTNANPQPLDEVRAWMKKHQPEAILSTEGNIIALLTAAGFRVPKDVGVAATSIMASDATAGMLENPMEVGRVAVKNLVALIQRGELGMPEFRQNILVRGNWQDGSTLPPVKR